jgi:hypothetical protein
MNGTPNEFLIQRIETIIVLGTCYDWKEEGKEKRYYFGHALKGEPITVVLQILGQHVYCCWEVPPSVRSHLLCSVA